MIKKLTPEQEKRLIEFRQEWFEWGTKTEPADRQKAENAITQMYAVLGKQKPKFVWCESPATCMMAIQVLKDSRIELSLESSLRSSLWSSLGSSLGSSLRSSLESSLRSSLRSSLWSSLGSSLRSSLRSSLGSSTLQELGNEWWGQYESYWISYYLFCRDVMGVEYDQEKSDHLNLWRDIAQSCGWWWAYENTVVISERPEICQMEKFGNVERLHCEFGPALKFRDGYSLWQIHGVTVSQLVVENPEQITVKMIDEESNIEARRIMIGRYGEGKYLKDSGAQKVSEDEWGILYRKELPNDEPIVLVEVKNSTPEPDGSIKTYFLRVDPRYRILKENNLFGEKYKPTPLNAIASTFGLSGEQYMKVKGCES